MKTGLIFLGALLLIATLVGYGLTRVDQPQVVNAEPQPIVVTVVVTVNAPDCGCVPQCPVQDGVPITGLLADPTDTVTATQTAIVPTATALKKWIPTSTNTLGSNSSKPKAKTATKAPPPTKVVPPTDNPPTSVPPTVKPPTDVPATVAPKPTNTKWVWHWPTRVKSTPKPGTTPTCSRKH